MLSYPGYPGYPGYPDYPTLQPRTQGTRVEQGNRQNIDNFGAAPEIIRELGLRPPSLSSSFPSVPSVMSPVKYCRDYYRVAKNEWATLVDESYYRPEDAIL